MVLSTVRLLHVLTQIELWGILSLSTRPQMVHIIYFFTVKVTSRDKITSILSEILRWRRSYSSNHTSNSFMAAHTVVIQVKLFAIARKMFSSTP